MSEKASRIISNSTKNQPDSNNEGGGRTKEVKYGENREKIINLIEGVKELREKRIRLSESGKVAKLSSEILEITNKIGKLENQIICLGGEYYHDRSGYLQFYI